VEFNFKFGLGEVAVATSPGIVPKLESADPPDVECDLLESRCHGTLQGRRRLRVTDSKRLLLYGETVVLRSHEIIVFIQASRDRHKLVLF